MSNARWQSRTGILGTGSCLPEKRVTNADVATTLHVEERWIVERIGILERRHVVDGERNTELAARAASAAISMAGISASDVDLLVVATSTPDRPIPPTATQVQAELGAGGAVAFDVNAACAGFLFAVDMASRMLGSDPRHRYAVVVGSDTYSRILNPADRQTYTLFGDGAGAVVLGGVPEGFGLIGSSLRSDGRLGALAVGGPQLPISAAGIEAGEHYARMVGHEVAEVVRKEFPEMVKEVTAEHDITVDEIDHLICHQANPRLVMRCARSAGFAPDQVVITGDRFGNTASASVPIGLDDAVRGGRIRHGDTVLMMSFGAGMTWGWSLCRWSSPVFQQDARSGHGSDVD